jgi:hypothetical protein
MSADGQEDIKIVKYSFPLSVSGDVNFAVKGAKVKKAELYDGSTLLSCITKFPEEYNDKSGEFLGGDVVNLDFFNGKPLHGALARDWRLRLELYVLDGDIPSLTYFNAMAGVTWLDYPSGVYKEKVVVSSESGPKDLIFVYFKTHGGFMRE